MCWSPNSSRFRQGGKRLFTYPLHQPELSSTEQGQRGIHFPFILYFHISAGAPRSVYWDINLSMKGKGESKRICQNPHIFGLQLHFLLKTSFPDLTSTDLPIFLDWINFLFTKSLHFQTFHLDGILALASWLIRHCQLQVCDYTAVKENICSPYLLP